MTALDILIDLAKNHEARLKQSLIDNGHVPQAEIDRLVNLVATDPNQSSFFGYVLSHKLISQNLITKQLAKLANFNYVDIGKDFEISPDALAIIPTDIANSLRAISFGRDQEGAVLVALANPGNLQAINLIQSALKTRIRLFITDPDYIEGFLSQTNISIASLSQDYQDQSQISSLATIDDDWSRSNSDIARALNSLIDYARQVNASDIHIEPMEKRIRIRLRIDGVLKELSQSEGRISKEIQVQLLARIKILANLRTDQTRAPQDGQFTMPLQNGQKIMLRVATTPVTYGEKAVLRLLRQSNLDLDLSRMGYIGRTRDLVEQSINYPDGIILTSGPTGSGKTTSMYALVNKIDRQKLNVVTLENPVEYEIDGINQIEINEAAGLTFSSGLRAVLRHDPDVILVGEIRDSETANLAIQAAMTGHLVFSTVHTNSAAGILPRLLNMGIEPFLIASTVRLVIGQRLIRQIASDRVFEYQSEPLETHEIKESLHGLLPEASLDPNQLESLNRRLGYEDLPSLEQDSYTLCRPTPGLSKDDDGYAGRIGVYEAFRVTDQIQELLNNQARAMLIEQAAVEEGMISLRQDGLLKALHGLTSISEVNRVSFSEAVKY